MRLSFRRQHKPDYTLISLIFVILAFGLIMLSSASSVASFRNFSNSYYYLWHNFTRGVIPGLILFFIAARTSYYKWQKAALSLFVFSLILMILIFVPGIGATHGTARSWIHFLGFSFQPSELLKLTLILYLAYLFSRRDKKVESTAEGFAPMLIILGVISGLLILQPDIGTLMILVLIGLAIYFVAGAYLWHLITFGLIGIGGVIGLIAIAPYRLARFTAFLDPSKDPLGIGYHINQALIAVGSGRFFGVGLGQSRQKFAYLPEVYCDSIFAIIGEELGFLFAALVVLAFVFLVVKGFEIARKADSDFGKYVAFGVSFWFAVQAVVNIMSMISLMPMTGVPLPFISYGGTAMAVNLLAAGILVNISKFTKV